MSHKCDVVITGDALTGKAQVVRCPQGCVVVWAGLPAGRVNLGVVRTLTAPSEARIAATCAAVEAELVAKHMEMN